MHTNIHTYIQVESVQPVKFKLEYWWSGVHLLHVIKQTILQPEIMQKTAFPNLTIPQAVYAYVHAITERFARCMYVCIEFIFFVHVHMYVIMSSFIFMYVYADLCIYVYMNVCMYVACLYVCMYVYI